MVFGANLILIAFGSEIHENPKLCWQADTKKSNMASKLAIVINREVITNKSEPKLEE